jgi:hypothetical protein
MKEIELDSPPEGATNVEELVKTYLTIRNEREKIEAEWKAQDREFENELKMIEQTLMVVCNDSNAKSIRTDSGTVFRRLNERYTVADGDLFRKFVMENEVPELFESRIAQSRFKEFIAERADEGLPPGVNVMREFAVVVRKPS